MITTEWDKPNTFRVSCLQGFMSFSKERDADGEYIVKSFPIGMRERIHVANLIMTSIY